MDYRSTNLWRKALEPRQADPLAAERARLASALDQFRVRATILAEEVSRSLPQLTDHSVRHLDALWELAGLVAGPSFEVSPTEALVFGGAVLLHDLGNAVAAYPEGLDALKGPEWDDLLVSVFLERFGRRPNEEELVNVPPEVFSSVLLRRLRDVHAVHAQILATQGFCAQDGSDRRLYLFDDEELRESLGPTIGRIASSHHWDMERVTLEFADPIGTPADLPPDWQIDPLSLACLLRVTDAVHLDSRRAPALARSFRKPEGDSGLHWEFQGRLLRPAVQEDQLVFSSKGAFPLDQREAWWLCQETLRYVDQELRRVDAVMRRERKLRRFAVRSVSNVENPQALTRHLPTVGWEPIDVRFKITDVLSVVDRFGGTKLYGENPRVALRELIANSADAVRARRFVEGRDNEWGDVRVTLALSDVSWWLEIEDNGIGMSEEVLRGPLLDFGTSYWQSGLARQEHPGLLSGGFKPTGRFGIGFFSVFMLGERVRVVTRQCGASADAVQVLELTKGAEARPYVRRGLREDPAERLLDGGTRVRVWLTADPFSEGGLLGRVSETGLVNRGSEAEDLPNRRFSHLCKIVGAVAPALDVAVYCQLLGMGEDRSKRVIQPNDWKKMPFSRLVERLGGPHKEKQKWRKTRVQRDIEKDGQLVARIGLCPPRHSFGGVGMITVGGLMAKERIQTFDGLIVGHDPILSRSEAAPEIGIEEMKCFLEGAALSISRADLTWADRLHFAQLLLNVGYSPDSITCFILPSGFAALVDVREWLRKKGEGDEIVIVTADEFEIVDGLGIERQITFDACVGRWSHPEEVVIVGETRSGELLPKLPAGPPRWGKLGEDSPRNLLRYLVDEMALIWNVDSADLWELSVSDMRSVGSLDSEFDFAPVMVDCLVLNRPDSL